MIDFLTRFDEFLLGERLVERHSHVTLAVSGGLDSMAMVHLFLAIREAWDLTVGIVHVQHGLRGEESEADESFVCTEARRHGVDVFVRKADVKGYSANHHLGTQESARILRYRAFQEARLHFGSRVVATAHTASDNAETVLFHCIRGAGIRGLAGIPVQREDGIIRPLLFATRSEIEAYGHDRRIRYREDSSNASDAYERNRLRHIVLPALRVQYDPAIEASLNRLSSATRILGRHMDELVSERRQHSVRVHPDHAVSIWLNQFKEMPAFLQEEIILSILRDMKVEPTLKRLKRVHALLGARPGTHIPVGNGVWGLRDRGEILLSPVVEKQESSNIPSKRRGFAIEVATGEQVPVGLGQVSISRPQAAAPDCLGNGAVEFADASRLAPTLTLRTWRNGDWFIPLGMKGKKKLSDFLTDAKVTSQERDRVLVLTNGEEIVWVVGKRLDDRYKLTTSTTAVVKLSHHLFV